MKSFKKIFLLMTLLLISACGYQLRGSLELPEGLENIYLQGATSQLKKSVKQALRSSEGQLVDNVQQAGLVVIIVREEMERRVLSLSSTGRANEYELNYLLSFNLLDAEGKVLLEQRKIEIIRDYFNDQEEVLGKNIEEQIIRQEMYRQGVQTIFRLARIALEKKNH